MSVALPMFPTFPHADTNWTATNPNRVFLEEHLSNPQLSDDEAPADTIAQLLELLDVNGQDDYGIIGPTQHAFKLAMESARTVDYLALPAGSPSVDSNGGIRLTWKHGGGQIRFICPHDKSKAPYIYQECESQSLVITDANSQMLLEKLSWLVSSANLL